MAGEEEMTWERTAEGGWKQCPPANDGRFLRAAAERTIVMTRDLAAAILEVDCIAYSEGQGPRSDKEWEAWRELLSLAEQVGGEKAVSTS
jgi:hypothetical protein